MRLSRQGIRNLAKMGLAFAIAIVLLILTINAIRNPVKTTTETYTADFSDVSGLHSNNDVRVRGVQVGKVTSIAVRREGGRSFARVSFTMAADEPLTGRSRRPHAVSAPRPRAPRSRRHR